MTAIAVRPAVRRETMLEPVSCEVRCPGLSGVFGYILVGNGAACLEKALADNGFRLVPALPGLHRTHSPAPV
jgi:hypothetical protein